MSKQKTRNPAQKAAARARLVKNQKAKYEKLIKDFPDHKDKELWERNLKSL